MSEELSETPLDNLHEKLPEDAEKIRKEFRELLNIGMICALIVGALQVASGVLELNEGFDTEGFTWGLGLALGAILPQLLVAATFWELGEKAGDRALSVSSVGTFLMLWATSLLQLVASDFVPKWLRIVLFLLVGLIVLATIGMISEKYPDLSSTYSTLFILLGLVMVGGGIALAIWLHMPVNRLVILCIAVVMSVVLGVIVMPVWWSLVMMRGRSRYGELSLLMGLGQFFAWLIQMGLLVVLVTEFRAILVNPAGFNPAAFEERMTPLLETVSVVEIVASGLWGLTIACLFWNLLGKEIDDLRGVGSPLELWPDAAPSSLDESEKPR
jgi:hypothetical protein